MIKEDLEEGRRKTAEFLFDGDKAKAEQLLILFDSYSSIPNIPDFKNLTMRIPADTCEWCDSSGYCWYYMPDSKLSCDGECEHFKGNE